MQKLNRSARRRLVVPAAALVAGALVVATVTRDDGSATGSELGPTVAAQTRDLATTLDASGSLRRSSEHTIAYASPLSSTGSNGSATADPLSSNPQSSSSTASAAGSPTTVTTTPSSSSTASSAASTSSSSSSTPSTTPPTTDPCPTTTAPTSTTSSSTPTTTPCPTTPTTTPPTSTPTTPPTTAPPDDGGDEGHGDEGHGGEGEAGEEGEEGDGDPEGQPGEGGEGATPGEGGEGANEVPSATLTSLVDVGTTATRGTVLYTADQQPVVALLGDLPAWRTLEQGVIDGADVQQLEENLVALGYSTSLTVDQTFTADTAAAVQAWETALGRTAPDGVVMIGDVVFLTAPGDVLGHEAEVGDTVDVGSPVLTIGSEQRVVVANVDATEAGGWTAGSTVEVEWADTTTVEGTVLGTGTTVTSGQVELTVALAPSDAGAGERRSGATASVTLVDADRADVIAVPVTAIVDANGQPAVRVAQPTAPDEVVQVETGLVANGWIEITSGLTEDDQVRLPA